MARFEISSTGQGMNPLSSMRRQRSLLNCAPISARQLADRSMRAALSRADGSAEFVDQQNFDRAVARLVRLIAIPAESAEWFSEKDLVPVAKRTWKNTLRNPAVLAISIAVAVIAGVFVFNFIGHLNDFPGSTTARKLLGVAASTRPVMLDPVNADAGTLSDLFFIFPAERDSKTGAVLRFPGWHYVHQEGWIGAVTEHNGVCFMAAMRGGDKDLAPYLSQPPNETPR